MLRSAHAQNQEGRTSNPAPPNTYHKGICLILRILNLILRKSVPYCRRLSRGYMLKSAFTQSRKGHTPTLSVSLVLGHMPKSAYTQNQEGRTPPVPDTCLACLGVYA